MEWIRVEDRLPEQEGRYFVMVTFTNPCISNNKIVRKNIAFAGNFSIENGFINLIPDQVITHWMEIPDLK